MAVDDAMPGAAPAEKEGGDKEDEGFECLIFQIVLAFSWVCGFG